MVLAAGVLFVGLLTTVVGLSFGSDRHFYNMLFDENVKGLVVGSRVNFQGVPIGAVSDIRFDDGRTAVRISVDPKAAVIQEITRGRLDRALVTGQVTVELEGFVPGTDVLENGGMIPPLRSTFNELTRTLPEVLDESAGLVGETRALIGRLSRALNDGNLNRIDSILSNLEAASQTLPGTVDGVLGEARATLAETRGSVAALRHTASLADQLLADPELRAMLSAARRAVERIDELEVRTAGILAELESMVGTSRQPLLQTLSVAQEALGELRSLARRLRVAPSSLLFGARVNELVVPATPPRGGR